jgi:hypothetical protein
LVFGPWTDAPEELDGWDAARFQQIADTPGRAWVDYEVEYPPGSVVLIEALAGNDAVGTQRALVIGSLFVDLAIAALLARFASRSVGLAYLVLGLPLVPAGLLRFDLWAAGLGAIGVMALHRKQATSFAAATVSGAAVKIAPGLLLPIAIATGRWREALVGTTVAAIVTAAWVGFAGTEAIEQVVSLRGVTGWHLESMPGSLVALFSTEQPRLEANAYRIGQLNDTIVLLARLALVATVLVFGWLTKQGPSTLERMAMMLLGTTAALMITSPLLSPQFLLWLTPAAALTWTGTDRRPFWLVAGSICLTAATLAAFGPPNLDHPAAAFLLLVRDMLLIAVVVTAALSLRVQSAVRAAGS